jgi:hypothetical protein
MTFSAFAASLALTPTPARAEEPLEVGGRALAFFPIGPREGEDRWAIGGLWQIAPMFTANYRRGLGSGFTADARLQTIGVYNQLGIGASWAAPWGPFALGLTFHADAFLGVLGKLFVETSLFNTLGWGILTNPGAFAGFRLTRDSSLTLKYEAYLSPYQSTQLGSVWISPGAPLYNGFGVSLIVEYTPAMKGVIYYGATLYNTRSNYPLWFNLETSSSSDTFSSRKIWYFGLLAGYEF